MNELKYLRHDSGNNPIRHRLVWLVVVVTVGIAVLVFFGLDALYSRSSQNVDHVIQERYRAEAKHIVETVLTLIESTVDGAIGPELDRGQQETVKRIVRNAKSDDGNGYLFLYDSQGLCLAHGDKPEKEGLNLMDRVDSNGVRLTEELLKAAKQGGGFVQYKHERGKDGPDGPAKDKVSYAQMLRGGEWWIGSGVYMEDIHRELNTVKDKQDRLIVVGKMIFLLLLVLLMSAVFLVGKYMTRSIVDNMTTLADSVERERLALAGRLHNFVGGFVMLLHHRLVAIHNAHDAETRASLINQCTDSISDFDGKCQEIENDIYPLDIRRYGLSEVLRAFLGSEGDQAQRTGEHGRPLGLVLTHDIQEMPRSTNRHELALYLVAQGIIHNVFKHAGASRCETSLAWQEGAVTLIVTDDGRGFCPENELEKGVSAKSRFGLRWIQAQVEVCEGTLTMVSSPGAGTTVCVTMPWPSVPGSGESERGTGT